MKQKIETLMVYNNFYKLFKKNIKSFKSLLREDKIIIINNTIISSNIIDNTLEFSNNNNTIILKYYLCKSNIQFEAIYIKLIEYGAYDLNTKRIFLCREAINESVYNSIKGWITDVSIKKLPKTIIE